MKSCLFLLRLQACTETFMRGPTLLLCASARVCGTCFVDIATLHGRAVTWLQLGSLPVEKQTGSSEVRLLNQPSTATGLAPGSFWWGRNDGSSFFHMGAEHQSIKASAKPESSTSQDFTQFGFVCFRRFMMLFILVLLSSIVNRPL